MVDHTAASGVNDPFLAQNGRHNGNNKVSCIGIDQRGFLYTIQLPAPVQDAVDSISSMVGPMGMLILGMLIAEMDLKKLMSYHRLWWITLLRLV